MRVQPKIGDDEQGHEYHDRMLAWHRQQDRKELVEAFRPLFEDLKKQLVELKHAVNKGKK